MMSINDFRVRTEQMLFKKKQRRESNDVNEKGRISDDFLIFF